MRATFVDPHAQMQDEDAVCLQLCCFHVLALFIIQANLRRFLITCAFVTVLSSAYTVFIIGHDSLHANFESTRTHAFHSDANFELDAQSIQASTFVASCDCLCSFDCHEGNEGNEGCDEGPEDQEDCGCIEVHEVHEGSEEHEGHEEVAPHAHGTTCSGDGCGHTEAEPQGHRARAESRARPSAQAMGESQVQADLGLASDEAQGPFRA